MRAGCCSSLPAPPHRTRSALPYVSVPSLGMRHGNCLEKLRGTGSVEWEWLPILKQSLIQMPVQFSRDPYVVEIPGRMGICMPYVVYPINASRVFVRELFYIQIA